jgi:hypothetical protein
MFEMFSSYLFGIRRITFGAGIDPRFLPDSTSRAARSKFQSRIRRVRKPLSFRSLLEKEKNHGQNGKRIILRANEIYLERRHFVRLSEYPCKAVFSH